MKINKLTNKQQTPITRLVNCKGNIIEPITEPTGNMASVASTNASYHVNGRLTNQLTSEPTNKRNFTNDIAYSYIDGVKCAVDYNKGLMTKDNFVDAVNHIGDSYNIGLYILAIEYVYLSIKKMIKNGVKSNDDAYIDLFTLKNAFFNNSYDSSNYINDLIHITYIDIIESIPQEKKTHDFIEKIAREIMQGKPTSNYQLHSRFCNCYYAVNSNPLIEYQCKVVNRVRSYYRNKGDLVERCEPKTTNTVAIEYASNQLEKQRVIELLQQHELLERISEVLENCTEQQKQVFEFRIKKGYSYQQIAKTTNSSVSSCANMYNKVIGRIRSEIDFREYVCDSNYGDIYMVGVQQIENVLN